MKNKKIIKNKKTQNKKNTEKQLGKQMVTFQSLEKEPAVAYNHKVVFFFSPKSQRAHPHCKSDAQKRHNTTSCGSCSCMVKLHQAFCISPSHNAFLGFLTSEKWQHFKADLLTNLDMLTL